MNRTALIPEVGFIGFGRRGAPVARAVVQAGWPLRVWARRPVAFAVLGPVPHRVCATPGELGAACDIVVLCLPDDQAVEEVLVGHGLIATMRPGAVIVNHGSGTPQAAARAANRGTAFGVDVVDAPILDRRPGGRDGGLSTVVGGDAEAYARIEPFLESYCATVRRVGGAGAGRQSQDRKSAAAVEPRRAHKMVALAGAMAIR